ncbi:MAG: endolytic transglycosylase MltG [Gemmiger sp.]
MLALYDTYAISGLPAGPISCPGYAAMEAALNPDEEYINEGTTSCHGPSRHRCGRAVLLRQDRRRALPELRQGRVGVVSAQAAL